MQKFLFILAMIAISMSAYGEKANLNPGDCYIVEKYFTGNGIRTYWHKRSFTFTNVAICESEEGAYSKSRPKIKIVKTDGSETIYRPVRLYRLIHHPVPLKVKECDL